jgi:hypothetical protein
MALERNADRLVRHQLTHRRAGRGPGVLALLLAIVAGSATAAGDEPRGRSLLQLDTDLSFSRESLDTHWSSVVRAPASTPDYSLAAALPPAEWNRMGQVSSLIEYTPPRMSAANPQVIVRPQFALGGSSDSLRSWLRFAGIEASHCMAPVMKMHSSFAGSTSQANVSVSARCSLH